MKYFNFKRYKFSTIFKNINLRKYNLSKVYKFFDFKKFNLHRFYKFLDLLAYKFNKIYKATILKKFKHISFYAICILFFVFFIYISIPFFFNYNKSKFENLVCGGINAKCSIQSDISYSFFPTPRIKFNNIEVKDFLNKSKVLAKIKKAEIKISLFNLYNKKKINYKNIKFSGADINFDLNKLEKYKDIFSKNNFSPISITQANINFFYKENNNLKIRDANFKYYFSKNENKGVLKGKFLGDSIYFSFEENKVEKNASTIFLLKLPKHKLFAKLNINNSTTNKKFFKGTALLKQGKNRLTATFDYKDDQIIIKNSNLRNFFTDGEINGKIMLLPYFDFDLDVALKGLNFNKLYNFIAKLDDQTKNNLFRINNKINGKLNLSTNKVYSKYNLVNSFESRLRFINGNISIDQLVLSLGKLGAADISGFIKNDKKYTNFRFENNIYLDNLKRFYNKFGVSNKQKIPFNLFISGNFDLIKLNMRLDEIQGEKKLKEEDLQYIEQEFNNIVLEEGYVSLFNFLKLKEFFKLITAEDS